MLKIGCHLSSSKGYLAMGKEAVKIGANTFQFFTRNPRGGSVKPLDLEDVAGSLDAVLEEFDRVIGLGRLKAVHLNDTMNPLGSHKDRHAKIGEGHIGLAAMENIINHPLLREMLFYLETPNDLEGYAEEIALLKGLYRQ